MTQVKIVTDSATELSQTELEKYEITIVPLSVMIDDTLYIDGETITHKEFMEKMEHSKALPKSSQPPIGKFVDAFNALNGPDVEILCITISEGLSGTIFSAQQAAQMSDAKVTVFDSKGTDRGTAYQVLEAAKLAQEGKTVAEILPAIEKIRANTQTYVAVMSLENLTKGGRVSRLTGALSSLLNVKLVIKLIDGSLDVVVKGRGMKTINRWLDAEIEEMKKHKLIEIAVSHADAAETATHVKSLFNNVFPGVPVTTDLTGPVIATHTGPGAFSVIYHYE